MKDTGDLRSYKFSTTCSVFLLLGQASADGVLAARVGERESGVSRSRKY